MLQISIKVQIQPQEYFYIISKNEQKKKLTLNTKLYLLTHYFMLYLYFKIKSEKCRRNSFICNWQNCASYDLAKKMTSFFSSFLWVSHLFHYWKVMGVLVSSSERRQRKILAKNSQPHNSSSFRSTFDVQEIWRIFGSIREMERPSFEACHYYWCLKAHWQRYIFNTSR